MTTRREIARQRKLHLDLGRNLKSERASFDSCPFFVTLPRTRRPATTGVSYKSRYFFQMKLNQTQGFGFRYRPIDLSEVLDSKVKTDASRLSSIHRPVSAPVESGAWSTKLPWGWFEKLSRPFATTPNSKLSPGAL
jgi:hypothetical protein